MDEWVNNWLSERVNEKWITELINELMNEWVKPSVRACCSFTWHSIKDLSSNFNNNYSYITPSIVLWHKSRTSNTDAASLPDVGKGIIMRRRRLGPNSQPSHGNLCPLSYVSSSWITCREISRVTPRSYKDLQRRNLPCSWKN